MLPPAVERTMARSLRGFDRLLPGRVVGLYVMGSTALGAYRPERSDIDFVAVVDGDLDAADGRRLRALYAASAARTGTGAILDRRSPLTGTANGVFVRAADLGRPVTEIPPLASQCGQTFVIGRGGDLNPVAWKVFAEQGITVRGPAPADLGLDWQPEILEAWNRGNLRSYWLPWADGVERSARARLRFRLRPRWSTAWGALGAPRLHRTIATGEVVSKEAAGEHALDVLPAEWHPLIRDALAWWRVEPGDRVDLPLRERALRTAALVREVARVADAL